MGAVVKMIALLYIWCSFCFPMFYAFCNFATSSWPIGSDPSPCGIPNKVFAGGSFAVTNVEQCEDICRNIYSCRFFTYNTIFGTCGIRTFEPSGQIDLANTRVGRKVQGLIPSCDGKVFVGKTYSIPNGNTGDCQSSCQS